MATVEDGEILELEQPAHLSADAPPAPLHHPPLSQNPYRGGDPFLGAQQLSAELPRAFARFRTSPYRPARTRSATLDDVDAQLLSPPPPEEPTLARDPYATGNTSSPAPQEALPESSSIPTHPHSFPLAASSDPRATSLPTLPTSHDLSWPPSAPSDASPTAFRGASSPQLLNPPEYNHDPDRYSPTPDQSLFPDTPVYHAEPAPPFFYGRQHPSVAPMNASPHPTSYDVPHREPAHTIHPPREAQAVFGHEVYAGTIVNETPFTANGAINQANDFTTVGLSYQTIHEVDSPRLGLLQTKVQEEEHVHRRGRGRSLGVHPSSRDPSPYNQQYNLSPRQRLGSETCTTKDVSRDEEGGEGGRMHVEPRMSSFSDEDDQHEKSADAPHAQNGHHGHSTPTHASKREDGESPSRPKTSEPKNENVSQDEASDGEIDSHIASPVISVATVPDESPSPPSSAKKKPATFDAKKHLSELRRKALMSVKKRPAVRTSSGSVEPMSPCAKQSTAATTGSEGVEGPQNVQSPLGGSRKNKDDERQLSASPDRLLNSSDELSPGCRIQLDSTVQIVVGGVRRTMTRKQFAEWQAWPYQNRVLVDYSSDSSDGDSGDERDDNDDGDDADGNLTGRVRRSAHRNRESEIEAMKIRMIRLGKCPSMLFGGSKSANETKNSSSSVSVEKQKDRPFPENGDKTPGKTNASHSLGEAPALVKEAGQEQENANSQLESSPKKSNASELMVSNSAATQGHSNSTLETPSDKIIATVSRQQVSMLRSPEKGNALDLVKISELVPDNTGGTPKSNAVEEGKSSSPLENGEHPNQGKESRVATRSPRPATGVLVASPIAELKRRIAAIEKTRDSLKQQRHKKQKTMTNQEIRGTERAPMDGEPKQLQYRVTGGTDLRRKSGMSTPQRVEPGRGGQRYYSSGSPDTIRRKQMALGIRDKRNGGVNIDTELQESRLDATGTQKPLSNENEDVERTLRLPDDNAERRYIDDLKLELEQKTKELMNERDRTEQLRIAEMAIAEAQAKLNFTRSRVAALQDELQKAEQEVVNAEKECRQRARVVAQLRLANGDNSIDIVSGQEEPTSGVQLTEVVDRSTASTTLDITTESGREEDMEQEDGKVADFVLRPSPYSPSVGDNFTSCLRALRAYASVTQLTSSAAR